MNLTAQKHPTTVSPALTPQSATGWIAVALGFGAAIGGPLLMFVMTDGGETTTSGWLPIVAKLSLVAMSLIGVLAGLRARRIDPSTLGTAALSLAAVVGAWFLFTGVVGHFFE